MGIAAFVRLSVIAALSAAALACAVAPAAADKRVALVIGNSKYVSVPALKNPANDAEAVSKSLRDLDFQVIVGLDLDRAGMNKVLDEFSRAADGADIAFVYYSGHGMQLGGANWLLPVETRLDSVADVNRFRLLPLQDVLETLRSVPGANRDALLTRGLVRLSAANGLLVAYATQADDVAADGTGRNSPFTSAFVKNVSVPDIDVRQMFFRVQDEVDRETAGKQRPELAISLVGEYKLKITITPVKPDGATPQTQATTPSRVETAQFCQSISTNTSIAVVQRLAQAYKGTTMGECAEARLEEMKKSQVAVVAPPVAPPAPPTIVQPAVGVFDQTRKPSQLTAAEERALKAKDSFKECDACPEMVVVPPGSFTMGSPRNEEGRYSDEGPQHNVSFARPFVAGKFAVTFDEWDACVADGGCNGYRPSDQGWGRGKRPVINVSWDDAKSYVAWLSRKTGKTYRLLSESEREYVARAGTITPYWWGTTISKQQANYSSDKTVPVDSFQPNPWGLYQVHGNVWEWTEDCWIDNYNVTPTDGSARTGGSCSSRVLRGGSWNNNPQFLRLAYRDWYPTVHRNYSFGLRLGRTASLTP